MPVTQSTEKLIFRSLVIASLALLGVSVWSAQTVLESIFSQSLPHHHALLSNLEKLRSELLMAEIYRRDDTEASVKSAALTQTYKAITKTLSELNPSADDNAEVQSNLARLQTAVTHFDVSPSAELHDVQTLESIDDAISDIQSAVHNNVLIKQEKHVQKLQSDFNLRYALVAMVAFIVAGLIFVFRLYTNQRNHSEHQVKKLNEDLAEANGLLERLACSDPLTDLLNRRGLVNALNGEVSRMKRTSSRMCALLIDCDDFKNINENHGYTVGDAVLIHTAKCLLQSIRPTDHASRIGGDEFIILLPDATIDMSMAIAERLRLLIANLSVPSGNSLIKTTVSTGVVEMPDNISTVEELLVLARMSLKRSKAMGKNKVSSLLSSGLDGYVATEDAEDIVERLASGATVRIFTQPIIRLSDDARVAQEFFCRGAVGAFEMPNDFFRLAQEHNALTQVDRICLQKCAEIVPLFSAVRAHLNIFPSTLLETPIEKLLELLVGSLRGRELCLEISEHQFLGDPDLMMPQVKALRDKGILIALDDCGFGRTSLESVIMLEPEFVKLDARCSKGVAGDRTKYRLLQRMTKLMLGTGAEVIAEGIESADDAKILKELGIKYAQGYLWGRPVSVQLEEAQPESQEATSVH